MVHSSEGDTCALVSSKSPTTIDHFLHMNPSLGTTYAGCEAKLEPVLTYCALPNVDAVPGEALEDPEDPEFPATTTTTNAEIPTPTDTPASRANVDR